MVLEQPAGAASTVFRSRARPWTRTLGVRPRFSRSAGAFHPRQTTRPLRRPVISERGPFDSAGAARAPNMALHRVAARMNGRQRFARRAGPSRTEAAAGAGLETAWRKGVIMAAFLSLRPGSAAGRTAPAEHPLRRSGPECLDLAGGVRNRTKETYTIPTRTRAMFGADLPKKRSDALRAVAWACRRAERRPGMRRFRAEFGDQEFHFREVQG